MELTVTAVGFFVDVNCFTSAKRKSAFNFGLFLTARVLGFFFWESPELNLELLQ